MDAVLENTSLRFSIDPQTCTWNVYDLKRNDVHLSGARTWITGWAGNVRRRLPGQGKPPHISQSTSSSPHGALHLLSLAYPPQTDGVCIKITFALPEQHPLLLWKIELDNQGHDPLYVSQIEMLQAAPPASTLQLGNVPGAPAFFSNGWQSWSYAGLYRAGDRQRRTYLGPFRAPTDFNAGTPHPWQRGHFASDMFGVLGAQSSRVALLAGFLSQLQHFGSLEARLNPLCLRLWANGDHARLDPGALLTTDWACLNFLDVDHPDPMGAYIQAVARQHNLPAAIEEPVPTGWCSWYQFSTENYVGAVTARDIQANLQSMVASQSRLPLQVCQIDDGFERHVGDWQSFTPGFPDGIAPLAREIRHAGLRPGLWLAPFIVDRTSHLAAAHPDWLLRGPSGLPANAGYLWNGFTSALDLTHPAALAYAVQSVRTAVHTWGFDYIKLDFLYAAALPGRYQDATRTRAQVMRAGLSALRDAAGENVTLLGCACPLGPAIGLVDAMRIGTDTAPRWLPAFASVEKPFKHEPNLPSARNSIYNAISRSALHRRWWVNDPDCLLLRPTSRLTHAEVITIASIMALTGGALMISDNLADLPPDRRWIAEVLLPLMGRMPQVIDWFDAAPPAHLRLDLAGACGAWSLLALINWDDHPSDLRLRLDDFRIAPQDSPRGEFFVRRFWLPQHSLTVERLQVDTPLVLKNIPAHGTALFAVRPAISGKPQYLGSDLHISQGLEVTEFQHTPATGTLCLKLARPGPACGQFYLALPCPPSTAFQDGGPQRWRPLTWEACGQGCYAFGVTMQQSAAIQITLQD